MKQLITGGARSGRSSLAEQLAQQLHKESGKQVIYIATANNALNDSQMAVRIDRHQ